MPSVLSRWRPYPAYKPSGVEWLGDIPAHWDALKIKRLCLVKRGASPRPIDDPIYFADDGEYAWVRIADVTSSEKYLTKTTQRLSQLGRSKSVALEPGEIFLSIAATVGKPIITRIKCCIHDGFVYFPGLRQNREYLYYLFASGQPYQGLGKLGTQLNLNTDTVGDIRIPLPLPDEQRAIAAFLDRETARIDALIARKQRLIELLQEKRSALISHAVTQGLDPNVEMKDSGVEWLGEIPGHWEIRRIKSLVTLVTSGSRGWAEFYSANGPIFIRIGNLSRKSINLDLTDTQHVDPPSSSEGRRTQVQPGDVLISVTADIGSIGVIPDKFSEAYVNQHIALTRPRTDIVHSRWLAYCLASAIGQWQFQQLQYGGTKVGLGLEDVNELRILLPPLEEQETIIDFIMHTENKLNRLAAQIQEAIDKLQEYRTALISAAVTGKIDVRPAP